MRLFGSKTQKVVFASIAVSCLAAVTAAAFLLLQIPPTVRVASNYIEALADGRYDEAAALQCPKFNEVFYTGGESENSDALSSKDPAILAALLREDIGWTGGFEITDSRNGEPEGVLIGDGETYKFMVLIEEYEKDSGCVKRFNYSRISQQDYERFGYTPP